jgi:hypothetical protein
MKFYYNDKLVRTSKTRHYKYAVGSEYSGFTTCSETLENAKRALEQLVRLNTATAKSNLEYAKDPEHLAELKKVFGADYDPEKSYTTAIENIKRFRIVELVEK